MISPPGDFATVGGKICSILALMMKGEGQMSGRGLMGGNYNHSKLQN